MTQVDLFPNPESYIFNNVALGTNKLMESLYINKNEAWYDSSGLIRMFTMTFDKGGVGTFMLMPKNKPLNIALKIVRDVLLPFGLEWSGNKIFHKNTLVDNISKALYTKFGKIAFKDILDGQLESNLGYVATDNGEVVFKNRIYMNQGNPISSLKFYLENKTFVPIKYQLSKDGNEWTEWKIEPGKTECWHFKNSQKHGLVRLETVDKGFFEFEIHSKKKYFVDWNKSKKVNWLYI